MILAMGDVGWPALLFAIAAMGAAIGLKRHLSLRPKNVSARLRPTWRPPDPGNSFFLTPRQTVPLPLREPRPGNVPEVCPGRGL